MTSYKAFGLIFASDLPLHLPTTEQSPHHVTIEVGTIDLRPTQPGSMDDFFFHADTEQICVWLADYGKILIQSGQRIIIQPEPGLSVDTQETLLLSIGIPLALHQRGLLVLHGSAVEVDGRAVAFLAFSGWGKSTLALAFNQRGHRLITDDHIVVHFAADGTPMVSPGFLHFKVYPNSAQAVGIHPDPLPKIFPEFDKRVYRLTEAETPTPVPLAALYLLDFGPEDRIDPVAANAALIELIRHTFVARYLQGTQTLDRHFRQCSDVAARVPVLRLTRTHDLDNLFRGVELVQRQSAKTRTDPILFPQAKNQ